MLKIILVLCAAVAIGHGEQLPSYSIGKKYITRNQQQYWNVLRNLNSQLNEFAESYSLRLESILLLADMTSASIVQTEHKVLPLEFLGELGNHCVNKYRVLMPILTETKQIMEQCYFNATTLIDTLLHNSVHSKNNLETITVHTYNKRIEDCSKQNLPLKDYTSCLTTVTKNTNIESIKIKKLFAKHMDAAECAAKGYIKSAYDCVYNEQARVSGLLAEANLLVNKCLNGNDECKPCDDPNSCTSVEVDTNNKVIVNPLYGPDYKQSCVILHPSNII